MSQLQHLFGEFVSYSDAFKGNTTKSLQWLNSTFKRFLKLTNAQQLTDFNSQTIEACIYAGRQNHNWSAKTIKNTVQVLSLFADWLVERKIIEENPTTSIPRPKVPKALPKPLSREQAEEIINWAESIKYPCAFDRIRAVAILSTFIFTGIRLSELQNLQVIDVNFSEKRIHIRLGKGLKDRFIPMNERLSSILNRYMNERSDCKKESPYFFTGTLSDHKVCEKLIPKLIKRIRDKSGIYFSAHTLRHTFACLMLQSGCDIYMLSKLMGHSDIKTTTIYLLVTDNEMKQKVARHPLNFKGYQPVQSFPSNF